MQRTGFLAALLVLLAAPAFAQLSDRWRAWPDGPEGVLLTPAERAAWAGVDSDAGAQRFVDLFWARRDPDLASRANETRADFEARVEAADRQLGEGGQRGALTDRGRVWLLLGKAAAVEHRPLLPYLREIYHDNPPDPANSLDTRLTWHGLSFDREKGVVTLWRYPREAVPAAALGDRKDKLFTFTFVDGDGSGAFALADDLRYAEEARELLAAVPATLVRHPELAEPPLYPLLPGSQLASPAQLAWLGLDPAPWPEGAVAAATQGVVLEDQMPAWVFLRLPEGAPAADLMAGRLTLADGTVAGTFQQPVAPLRTARGAVYELAVPAPAGTSTLDLALAAGGQPIAVRRLALELAAVAPGATWIGPMMAGGEVVEEGTAGLGHPFVFGGYHLILRPEGSYSWDETMSYFCLVVRPGAGADGSPAVTFQERLKLGPRQAPVQPPQPAQLSATAPNVSIFGLKLPLATYLPQGGDWTLKVTLKDTVNQVDRATELPIRLPEKSPAPQP